MSWAKIAILGMTGGTSAVIGQVRLPSPGGVEFLMVLGSLFIIAAMIAIAQNIMVNRRRLLAPDEPKRWISPQPLDVRNVHDAVSQPQFEKLERETDRRFEKVYAMIDRIGINTDKRINDVLKEVSVLRGAFDQSQRRRRENND